MAHHRSAEKRIRQAARRTARNKYFKATMRGLIRRTREAISEGDAEKAQTALQDCAKQIDRVVSKGVCHRNTGSRYISRLSSQVAALEHRTG